jgi:large subunit ribosomal protein L25
MELKATVRQIKGSQVKNLREDFKVPAVVYGLGNPSISLEIGYNEFVKVLRASGLTSLVDLNIEGNTKKVLIKELQKDPVSGKVIHVSFIELNLKVKTKAYIPVVVTGEEDCSVLKSGEGILNIIKQEIHVEALPTDLPHEFTVDVSGLENIGDEIKISQIAFDREKVALVDDSEDDLVLNIDRPQEEVAEETAVSEEEMIANLEASKEKKPEEETSEEEK